MTTRQGWAQSVRFGERRVGAGEPCFVTFEAGPTHSGLESALRLVDLAARAGADAVKFQMVDPERLVADRQQPMSYEVLVDRESGKTETVTEPLYELLRRRALEPEEWRQLKRRCDELKLAFFATVAFEDEIDFLAELGCHSVKIASADVNHLPLLRRAARTGMCLQLDTGNATVGEIERAVEVVCEEGAEDVIIHHCPSGYPARLEGINLNVIPTLKRMFPHPIAFSDHSPGWVMDVAAVALGADLVEKTITEDRTTRSIEHMFSLDPPDMAAFVETVRQVEAALGSPRRVLHPEERQRRRAIRRSAHLEAPVKTGQRLDEAQLLFRRPGFGVGPDEVESLGERRFRRDLPAGHVLTVGDLE